LQPNGTKWSETVLYKFTGGSDGAEPYGRLVFDDAGNLYGTTYFGGSCNGGGNCGVIFEIDASHNFSVVHSFAGYP